MSRVRKTLTLPEPERLSESIDRKLIVYLRQLNNEILMSYRRIYDSIESGGMSTKSWSVREATAADVTAGDAAVAGNLIVVHKTSGTKFEHEV